MKEGSLLVLLPNESLHGAVHLVDVYGDLRFRVSGVVRLVGFCVAHTLHVVNLRVVPFVHAQRLHFRDVRAELAVDGGAPHAQEYAQTPASPSWVSRAAVGTGAIARDRLDELLQRALVARLLALVQRRRHVVAREAAVAGRWRWERGPEQTRGEGGGCLRTAGRRLLSQNNLLRSDDFHKGGGVQSGIRERKGSSSCPPLRGR